MSRIKKSCFCFTMMCLLAAALFAQGGSVNQKPLSEGISNHIAIGDFQPPECGWAIFIDLDAFTLTVYRDGAVVKVYPVSGGTNETPSPVGTWHVNNISDWGESFGGSWVGLDVPWGVFGIHGTVKPWLVGKKHVSHGCIRMKDQDVDELRRLVQVGTVVRIKHDALPFRKMGLDVRGSDVQYVQNLLNDLGYYTGQLDGVFGKEMVRAVKSFQKTYALPADGIIGKVTYEKILEQVAAVPA